MKTKDCKQIYVESQYRSKWKGVILQQVDRKDAGPLCLVLITNDKNGNKPNRRYLKILAKAWLREVPPFSLDHVPPEWWIYQGLPGLTIADREQRNYLYNKYDRKGKYQLKHIPDTA